MVTDRLTEGMGFEPNLSVKQSVTIDTMLYFDGDEHGQDHGAGTCKQALRKTTTHVVNVCFLKMIQ